MADNRAVNAATATTDDQAADRTLIIERVFKASPEKVFKAWTDPAILVKWWGPEGFETPECEMDVRAGGAWRTTMVSPKGEGHTVSGIYREISPPKRLVMTWGWEQDGERGHETVIEVTLESTGRGDQDAARAERVRKPERPRYAFTGMGLDLRRPRTFRRFIDTESEKMEQHPIVPHDEWVAARQDLLNQEKKFTRLRDRLSRTRRDLPWERVEKSYVFDGPDGEASLAELFDGRSQLIVYHFMFGPDWKTGCKSCSFWADNFNEIIDHLHQRDVTFVAVSRAPLATLEAFKRRMGWSFPWYSSERSEFNFDLAVSFSDDEVTDGKKLYNFGTLPPQVGEMPGTSVFYKDPDGAVFHTYSCYARGLDMQNTAYHYLDLVPEGRDEKDLPHTMSWLKLHDEYAA